MNVSVIMSAGISSSLRMTPSLCLCSIVTKLAGAKQAPSGGRPGGRAGSAVGGWLVGCEGGIDLGFASLGWIFPEVDGKSRAALEVVGEAEPPGTLQTQEVESLGIP